MSTAADVCLRPGSAVLTSAADVLRALSNGRRLTVLSTLIRMNEESGPVRISDLAGELGFEVRTVVKEVMRLAEARLVTRDDGLLTARILPLGGLAEAVAECTVLCQIIPPQSPLRRYLSHGRITLLPKRPEDLEAMAAALAQLLPSDRSLDETEVNALLGQAGDDVASLRRLLVDMGLVQRYGSAGYRRRP